MIFSTVNTGTTILAKDGYNIAVTAAINSFTANGINIPTSTTNQAYLSHAPLLVTGNITNATIGTIFYYYDGDLSS
ncbi:MAG: hypothetical protein FJZ59_07580 [Chlamydiae bacterium]|nr:hypothetical protein [Chlamydiota bacterium]